MKPTEEDIEPTDEEIEAAATKAREEFEAYEGDEYLIKDWVDEDTPREKAIQYIQEPFTLSVILAMQGLECILADKYASSGLKKLLIERQPGILAELAAYAERRKPQGKPGPRPKGGKYKQDVIAELDAKGLTNGQIAIAVYGDSKKASLVAAHLAQFRSKQKKQAEAPQ